MAGICGTAPDSPRGCPGKIGDWRVLSFRGPLWGPILAPPWFQLWSLLWTLRALGLRVLFAKAGRAPRVLLVNLVKKFE